MKRLLFALIAGAMVFTVAFASAAALNVNGNTIQAGVDNDLACDHDGVGADWGLETNDNSVRSVTINGISTDCQGQQMWVQVNTNPGDPYGPVTIDNSGKAKFSFSAPFPAPENINSLRVWIEG